MFQIQTRSRLICIHLLRTITGVTSSVSLFLCVIKHSGLLFVFIRNLIIFCTVIFIRV